MDDQDTEYLKLPIEDRCQHKMWKARVSGYEAATKLFQQITDEKSPEWNKYLGLVKKFVVDSNAVAQEKGLDAVLAYVENAGCAGKTCGEVVSGIVSKCLGAPKARTKEKGQAIIRMYIEIEKHELVHEELIKGFSNKTPKVVVACIQTIREGLREFGPKVVALKPLVKQLPALLEDRDKGVRDEAKLLAVEIFRWIGATLKPQLTSLKPVMLTELETEFEKVGAAKAAPTRFLRSQQEIQARVQQELATADADEQEDDECDGGQSEIDPYDLLEPVNILSKLPNDFYEKCEAKKWQERKEAMDLLQQLSSNPKLEPGDYGDVVRVLKKIIGKDSNVVVIAVAGKCLAGLANGLKSKFHPYAGQCISTILEKFKEKKQTVVLSMREAIDAIYPSTTLDAIQDDVVAALDNKNPAVKAETVAFLTRCFSHCNMVTLNKKLLKTFCTALIKTLNDTDPTVRDNSAEALGTAMKVVGEKILLPFLQDVDALKMGKVKECCEKAVIVAPKVPGGSKVKAVRSAPAQQRKDADEITNSRKNIPQKSASVPSTNRKVVRGGQSKAAPTRKGDSSSSTSVMNSEFDEKELTPEEAEERAATILAPEILSGICDSNWKLRLSFMEQLLEFVKSSDKKTLPVQVLIRTMAKKPGFKENNFQVLKLKLDIIICLALEGSFSRCTAKFCVLELTDKLGDAKNGAFVAEALSAIAQATKLEFVSSQVLETAFAQKSPKTHMEAMNWLANAIKEFGLQIHVKTVIEFIKKAIAATNPGVRTAAVNLLGVMYLYIGSSLRTFFDSEKGAMLQQIDAEFEKLQGIPPPAPTRGMSAEAELADGVGDEDGGDGNPSVINIADLIPRTEICNPEDIGTSITPSLIQEMSDKNWKTRGEALQKLANIVSEAKFITPNLGDLPPVLKARMMDSNKNLAVQALNICQAIGTAMGPNCTKHVRTLAPGMIASLGDNKSNVRGAALTCLNGWLEQCGLGPFVEGDMLADALKLENPCLRAELLGWLTTTLPQAKTVSPDLMFCVPHLYSGLEDRNSDVRKRAGDAVLPFMIHLGYEKMVQAMGKLKPASKSVIAGILEKTKPNLPAKPAPKRAQAAGNKNGGAQQRANGNSANNPRSSQEDLDVGSSAKSGNANSKNGMKRATSRSRMPGTTKPSTAKKKDEDVDTSPPLQQNNLKEQRHLDEQRLKVLKWNFTLPRDEFYEQLKDQMTTAGFNRNLQTNMLHNDFKLHIKAIETLIDCLDSYPEATIANLDLVLKWLALRFFDTNPSVLLKGLEYLQSLFILLSQNKYHLAEHEANAFIPYLVMKVGDPKDTVRQSVRFIFKHICQVYSAPRMFVHVMEGLKSKNARQRTECLEELGCLIESYGVNVCQPSATAALKEVTRHISDRDNGVRNAALNCIVQAYVLEGEKVYKYVGPISDKDLCLLEERIKRTSRNRPPPIAVNRGPTISPESARTGRPGTKQLTPHQSPNQQQNIEPAKKENEEEQEAVIKRGNLHAPSSRPTSGMFCLDLDRIEQMMEEKVEMELPKLIKPDLDDILSAAPVRLPETRMRPPSPATKLLSNSSDIAAALDLVISQSASNDITTAVNALAQIDEFLKDEDRAEMMQARVDQLILAETFQFRMVYSRHMSDETTNRQEVMRLYRCLTMTLVTLFNNRGLAKKASKDVLCDLIYNLITILLDDRLNLLDDGPQVVRSINVLIVKVVERANSTNILSALIKLLSDCVGSETCSTKFIELVMKCLWKMVRMMPSILDDLNLDKILLELHLFLKAFPSSQWKDRSSDVPLRTVKTVLHSLVHHKGNKILDHLSAIDNLRDSELEPYLQRLLKSVGKHRGSENDGTKPSKKDSKSPKRLSKNTHEMLAEIFKKIGSKEYTKEGLADLYDFKKSHPDADVEPFLKKSSQFFQSYIERGLHTIDMDRNSKSSSTVTTPTHVASRQNSQETTNLPMDSVDLMPLANVNSNSNANNLAATVMNANMTKQIDANLGANSEDTPSVLMERLNILRARCGYGHTVNEKSLAASLASKGYATPPEPLTHVAEVKTDEPMHIPMGIPRSESSDAVTSLSGKANTDVDELRQRLERIKNATKMQ